MKTITTIIWDTYGAMLKEASESSGVDVDVYCRHDFDSDPSAVAKAIASMKNADLILLYHTGQPFWMELDEEVEKMRSSKSVISVGSNPMDFALTSTEPRIALECYKYLSNSGTENCRRVLDYIKKECFGIDCEVLPPEELPWFGLYHPDLSFRISDMEDYLEWYPAKAGAPWVGILMSRSSFVNDGGTTEADLIRSLESKGANVIAAYTMSTKDEEKGSINISDTIKRYFIRNGRTAVDAIVKLIPFLIGDVEYEDGSVKKATEFLRELDVPVFQPLVPSNISEEAFERSPGLSSDIPWCIAFPEFEGMIEPMLLGFTRKADGDERSKYAIPNRVERISDRVLERIKLRKKPNSEKKVAFLLNNYPCASAEANIGGASHLDTHKSMVNVMQAMKDAGYDVEVPEDGKQLIDNILAKKAMSDFRWTTVDEISKCGGVIHYMTATEYRELFDRLSPAVKKNMIDTWGEPPGEGMVLDDKILITGVSYGNVIVGVQPKRGCFGAKCDGSVCKILHDPLCPPTHQYLATYYYYEEVWGADAVIHVGTHGNLEFLPGKSTALTSDCYPDISIGKAPHIYIYNADNPPEGTIAKRRSYATLIDHMQTVMVGAGLYSELEDLDQMLSQYDTARNDPSRAHQYKHLILDAVEKAKLCNLKLTKDDSLDEIVRVCHEELSKIRNSQMNLGMHVFGEIPQGEMRAELINSIMRYDSGTGSIRDVVAACRGLNLKTLYKDQGGYNERYGMSNGRLIESIGRETRDLIAEVCSGKDIIQAAREMGLDCGDGRESEFRAYGEKIDDIIRRMDDSKELDSFIHALDGGYTEAGPSGLITRGRADILPTGRNFYSLDPKRVPTEASWRVGTMLAENTIKKHIEDTGDMPESIAFFWMSNDIMMADGEVMSQIMYLIGAKPLWSPNGQVERYSIIPLEELGRPRIDVTVRSSGILRDNFINCIDLIDSAIKEISMLDESDDMNFIRKHTKESVSLGIGEDDATARIFAAPPGSYASGVNLAIYASSWKTEEDLANIYIAGNGYAYGNGRKGKGLHEQFAKSLSSVSATYNKIASDEHDLLGCCCYFSNQGGLTAASKFMSGKDVKTYYGDTREPNDINVHTLADEIRRVVRTKLLNPRWIEGMKDHGYKGAADMMKRIGRVYGFEATTQQVDDWIFDDIANTFVNDDEMRQFYKENNPYALEEISRRLLEAEQRGLWVADEETLDNLRSNYMEIESWMEELAGEGEFQGGSIDIISPDEVESWNQNISSIMGKVNTVMHKRSNFR